METRPVPQIPKGDKVESSKQEGQGNPVKEEGKSQEQGCLSCTESFPAQILIARVKLGQAGKDDAHD